MLKSHDVAYTEHVYEYVGHGGTGVSSSSLGVDEHHVVKTLIFEDEKRHPLCVLMHGDRKVSTKELARQIGVKRVAPCTPDDAHRHSGYQVGGCSPFGLRKPMPVYMQQSVIALERIYINGGRRGFLVGLTPADVVRVVNPTLVDAALPH
jgi:Cys-tRNA(Pro) deacylase